MKKKFPTKFTFHERGKVEKRKWGQYVYYRNYPGYVNLEITILEDQEVVLKHQGHKFEHFITILGSIEMTVDGASTIIPAKLDVVSIIIEKGKTYRIKAVDKNYARILVIGEGLPEDAEEENNNE